MFIYLCIYRKPWISIVTSHSTPQVSILFSDCFHISNFILWQCETWISHPSHIYSSHFSTFFMLDFIPHHSTKRDVIKIPVITILLSIMNTFYSSFYLILVVLGITKYSKFTENSLPFISIILYSLDFLHIHGKSHPPLLDLPS